ncbi:MAG: glycosyltransferase family 4 protein, partial [Planctomycetota bacterium]
GFADYLSVSAALRSRLRLPTVHTMYCPIPARGGRWNKPVVRTLIRRWGRGLDALNGMSENVASSMRDFGLGSVEVAQPAIDLQRFHPGPAPEERAALGLADDEVAILFVGNAKPQKNLSGVLRAFAEVRRTHARARLVITTELAQSSPDHRLAELRREMIDLGLESSIVQKGIVDDMPRLMRACDLLVAPFVDSLGPSDYFMAALEAMASGMPVVVSAVGGMPEVVDDDRGALVDPHDGAALAAALDRVVGDAERRHAAGRCARSYTERHFDPARVVRRFTEIYTGIRS